MRDDMLDGVRSVLASPYEGRAEDEAQATLRAKISASESTIREGNERGPADIISSMRLSISSPFWDEQ